MYMCVLQKGFLFLLLAAVSLPAFAENPPLTTYPWTNGPGPSEMVNQNFGKMLEEAANYRSRSLYYRLKPETIGRTDLGFDASQCERFYSDLFKSRTVRIRILYGYYETFYLDPSHGNKPFVALRDSVEIDLLHSHLERPCPNSETFDCGFERPQRSLWNRLWTDRLLDLRWQREPVRLRRMIAGPQGETVTLLVELVSSSASDDDRQNRDPLDFNSPSPEQTLQTNAAKTTFYQGLQDAEVMMYLGHSRDGGGPSFEPSILKPFRAGSAYLSEPEDYSKYRETQPGFHGLVVHMESVPHVPKILALLSCKSAPHFLEGDLHTPQATKLRDRFLSVLKAKGVTFVGTTGLTNSVADLPNAAGLVDAIGGMRCGASFRGSIGKYLFEPGQRRGTQRVKSKTAVFGPVP